MTFISRPRYSTTLTFHDSSRFGVYVGVSDKQDMNKTSAFPVKRIVIHPEVFLHPTKYFIYNNDIALLELNTSVAIGRRVNHYSVNSICLPPENYTFTESRIYGLITGWGSVNDTVIVEPRYLQMAWVTFIPPKNNKSKILINRTPLETGSSPCKV